VITCQVLSHNLSGGTEENHHDPQDNRCVCRGLKGPHSEYQLGVFSLG
jgi:hypothetical protein